MFIKNGKTFTSQIGNITIVIIIAVLIVYYTCIPRLKDFIDIWNRLSSVQNKTAEVKLCVGWLQGPLSPGQVCTRC